MKPWFPRRGKDIIVDMAMSLWSTIVFQRERGEARDLSIVLSLEYVRGNLVLVQRDMQSN
jgi:hypothetical protein